MRQGVRHQTGVTPGLYRLLPERHAADLRSARGRGPAHARHRRRRGDHHAAPAVAAQQPARCRPARCSTTAPIDADASIHAAVLRARTDGQPRPVFSAGYHVGGFDGETHDPQLFERVPDAIERLRLPTLCALGGSVYGGATDLVLACDLRASLAGAEWRMPAVALGLHYYPAGLRRYVTRFGLNAAKRAFLTAQALPVESLAALGLFEEVASAGSLRGRRRRTRADAPGLALLAAQTTKRSLNERSPPATTTSTPCVPRGAHRRQRGLRRGLRAFCRAAKATLVGR